MYTPLFNRMIGYTSSASVSHSSADTDATLVPTEVAEPITVIPRKASVHADPTPNEETTKAPLTCKEKAYNMFCDCLDSIADACTVM